MTLNLQVLHQTWDQALHGKYLTTDYDLAQDLFDEQLLCQGVWRLLLRERT